MQRIPQKRVGGSGMSVRNADERQRRRHAEWVRASIAQTQATNVRFFVKAFDSLPTPRGMAEHMRRMQIYEAEDRASTGVLGQVVGMRDLAMPPDPLDDGSGGPNEMALLAGAASAAVLVGAVRAAMNRWAAARSPATVARRPPSTPAAAEAPVPLPEDWSESERVPSGATKGTYESSSSSRSLSFLDRSRMASRSSARSSFCCAR